MARMLQENVVTYKTPALAHLFHSFPHLNVSGHHVNSAFAPWSELYLEVSYINIYINVMIFNKFYVLVAWYSGFYSLLVVDNYHVFIVNLSYDKML